MSGITLGLADLTHSTEVDHFLVQHFFSREPLGLRLGIKPVQDTQEWLSQVTKPILSQQVVLPAINVIACYSSYAYI